MRADRHEEADIRFLQFCERALKMTPNQMRPHLNF